VRAKGYEEDVVNFHVFADRTASGVALEHDFQWVLKPILLILALP
jgi:hypothetical protein